jgi:hypothetical protein
MIEERYARHSLIQLDARRDNSGAATYDLLRLRYVLVAAVKEIAENDIGMSCDAIESDGPCDLAYDRCWEMELSFIGRNV